MVSFRGFSGSTNKKVNFVLDRLSWVKFVISGAKWGQFLKTIAIPSCNFVYNYKENRINKNNKLMYLKLIQNFANLFHYLHNLNLYNPPIYYIC